MDIRTADDKTAALEALLNEARIDANELRVRVEHYRRIMASTRLIMAHELKKPATAISGYLELASDDVARAGLDEARTLIDKARAECELLCELNAFYLELLKVDDASGRPCAHRVDVENVIAEVLEHLQGGPSASKRVRVTTVDPLPWVPVNRNALRLIIQNLLENALNYSTDESVVRIDVEVSRDLRGFGGGELLKLRISDHGSGISADDLKRVFHPFVRLEPGKMEGSGLGLTLVRTLVDMCDGDVAVRSEEGSGTTVFVTLPLMPGGEPEVVVP